MKAGNQNRVVLLGEGGTPWGVALGHDCKAEHEHGYAGLRAWLGVAEDVASMAVALLAERFAGYVTGTTVVVDGGLALHSWISPPAG